MGCGSGPRLNCAGRSIFKFCGPTRSREAGRAKRDRSSTTRIEYDWSADRADSEVIIGTAAKDAILQPGASGSGRRLGQRSARRTLAGAAATSQVIRPDQIVHRFSNGILA